VLLGGGELQVSVLHAIALVAVEQPLRAREPSARAARVTAEEELEPQPEGTARGSRALATVEPRVVRALEPAERLVVEADQVRRGRQRLEVRRRQPLDGVGGRERPVGVPPRALTVRLAAPLELVHHRPEIYPGRRGCARGHRDSLPVTAPAALALQQFG